MSPYPYCCRYESVDVSLRVSTGIWCYYSVLLFSILVDGTVVELRWIPSLVVLSPLNYPDEQSHTETAAESTLCSQVATKNCRKCTNLAFPPRPKLYISVSFCNIIYLPVWSPCDCSMQNQHNSSQVACCLRGHYSETTTMTLPQHSSILYPCSWLNDRTWRNS